VISWYQVPKGAHLSAATPVLVATGRASFSGSGSKNIAIKLTTKGKQLARRSAKLTATATFTASGGTPVVTLRTFTLKR
jgi:hypothetical protein